MITTINVRCQQCGAPLQVADGVRFLTCGYCHAELQVVRSESVVHTQILEKLDQRTTEMSESLKVIEIQNEIGRLDREWEMWRQQQLPRDTQGQPYEPSPPLPAISKGTCLRIALSVGIVAGIIMWMLQVPWYLAAWVPPVMYFGLRWTSSPSAEQLWFARAKRSYKNKRATLLADLANARGTR